MTEHVCTSLLRPLQDYGSIRYSPRDGWLLRLATSAGAINTSITHCPYCGEHLEIPDEIVAVEASLTDWQELRRILLEDSRHLAALDRWTARLHVALGTHR